MLNFHDPAEIAQDALVMSKLWHTVSGLYIWEFFTTLQYEWDVIRGRLRYKRTIWIYSLARVAALVCVILGIFLLDNRKKINCQVAFTFALSSSFVSMSASSLLIVLRMYVLANTFAILPSPPSQALIEIASIAIWNRKKVVEVLSIGIWVVNVGFYLQGSARLRASWVPPQRGCFPVNGEDNKPTLVSMLATDVILLIIMLAGLFRLRQGGRGSGTYGLTRLMWKQGVVWLVIATIAEVLPVLFIFLGWNEPFNAMFQPPSFTTMAIAATRMHRGLVDFSSNEKAKQNFTSGTTNVYFNNLPVPDTEKCINVAAVPTDPSQTEVVMHVVSERTQYDDSSSSGDEQADKKGSRLGLGNDLECGV